MLRSEIKANARAVLRGAWLMPFLTTLLVSIATLVAGVALPGIGGLLIGLPLTVSVSLYFLHIYRGRNPDLGVAFGAFSNYLANLTSMFWVGLFTFLWSLLFVIPGIIKSFSYAMTPYLIAEFPDALDYRSSVKASMAIMDGRKMELFIFELSFILWYLLIPVTFGLAAIYVTPYVYTATSGFYDSACDEAIAEGKLEQFGITARAV